MSVSKIVVVQSGQFLDGFKPTSLNHYIDNVREQYSKIKGFQHIDMKAVQIRAVFDFISELMQTFRVVSVQSYETLFRMESIEATPLQVLSYTYADIVGQLHLAYEDKLIAIQVDHYYKFFELEKIVKLSSEVDEEIKNKIMGIWEKCLNKYIPNRTSTAV